MYEIHNRMYFYHRIYPAFWSPVRDRKKGLIEILYDSLHGNPYRILSRGPEAECQSLPTRETA